MGVQQQEYKTESKVIGVLRWECNVCCPLLHDNSDASHGYSWHVRACATYPGRFSGRGLLSRREVRGGGHHFGCLRHQKGLRSLACTAKATCSLLLSEQIQFRNMRQCSQHISLCATCITAPGSCSCVL